MNGILLVDKPSGITSHDVVDAIRKRFGFHKVGHAGTLDPMATGLLIILIGNATKKSKYFINDDKAYKAEFILGVTTNTGDKEGNILEKRAHNVDPNKIQEVLERFIGEIEQIPPMFSAKKYNGKKLYEYARKGIEVKRDPRKITIKSLKILNIRKNELSLKIYCSKGTYIRQLAVDIGNDLGTGAHVSQLRRIKSGKFNVDESIKFDEIARSEKKLIYENIIQT